MAGWSDWYSGNMAPPLSMPGGGYVPAPTYTPPSTVDEIYEGIIAPPSSGLAARPVNTVPINPQTGMPYAAPASTPAAPSLPPNVYQPAGSVVANKGQDRLPATTGNADLLSGYGPAMPGPPAIAAINSAAPMVPDYKGYGASMRFASTPRAPSDGIINLSELELSDRAAQNTADSEGKPVRPKNGKVYYPGGKAPSGNVSGSLSARDSRGPLSQALGLKTSGAGGLLGGRFGGLFGGGASQSGGGGGLFSGGQVTRAPLAGSAMVVDPSTSAGSVLESMGFSSGGIVPAATVQNLSDRGYF